MGRGMFKCRSKASSILVLICTGGLLAWVHSLIPHVDPSDKAGTKVYFDSDEISYDIPTQSQEKTFDDDGTERQQNSDVPHDKVSKRPTPVQSGPAPRLKIIELSYMRSGSTMCGDILQAHPDVFYVYEPLFYLLDLMPGKNENYAEMRRMVKHYWRVHKPYIPTPVEFLTYMFNCNLTSHNAEFLSNTKHSEDFIGCQIITVDRQPVLNASQNCVEKLIHRCLNSKAIVQKVVRLSMVEADQYLNRDPTLRIIHQLRDPRGVLLSRMHFNNKTDGEMHNNYSIVCNRMLADLSFSKAIAQSHWGKILTVRYEDLVQDPLGVTSIMYKFAGLELLPSVKDRLHQMTSSVSTGSRQIIGMKTSRKNPFKTAYNWRQELSFSLVRKVQEECKELLHDLGYVSFTNEKDLRNMDIPAKYDIYGGGLFRSLDVEKDI